MFPNTIEAWFTMHNQWWISLPSSFTAVQLQRSLKTLRIFLIWLVYIFLCLCVCHFSNNKKGGRVKKGSKNTHKCSNMVTKVNLPFQPCTFLTISPHSFVKTCANYFLKPIINQTTKWEQRCFHFNLPLQLISTCNQHCYHQVRTNLLTCWRLKIEQADRGNDQLQSCGKESLHGTLCSPVNIIVEQFWPTLFYNIASGNWG